MRNFFTAVACIFFAFTFSEISGQNQHWCGLQGKNAREVAQQLLENRQEMRDFVRLRGAVTYVPVRFFMVAKSDGTGRASEKLALEALCIMNEDYFDQDIQFYLKEFKYLNNTSVHSTPGSFAGSNTISNQMNGNYNALNVFVVNDAGGDAAAYYQPPAGPSGNDWIVAASTYLNDDRVLSHEVGHFFSLNHTFYGWEGSGGWDPAVHGNPVGAISPDGIPNELVNGSNCLVAGDMVCDTPADYMFPSNTCVYNQNAKDPTGALLNPDYKNMMNYAFNCSEYYFSDDQKDEIDNSLFSNSRNYVRPNFTPTLTPVEGTPTTISPVNDEVTASYNYVELQWTSVPGATRYLVELSASAVPSVRYIVNTNSLVLTTLTADKSYLWKVMAYNDYHTCGNYSSQKKFKTGELFSASNDVAEIAEWAVSPNPVRSGTSIFVNITTVNGVKADVKMTTLTGQTVQEMAGYQFPGGTTSLEIKTDNLPAGVYLVSLQSATAVEVQRIVISR